MSINFVMLAFIFYISLQRRVLDIELTIDFSIILIASKVGCATRMLMFLLQFPLEPRISICDQTCAGVDLPPGWSRN